MQHTRFVAASIARLLVTRFARRRERGAPAETPSPGSAP
jgi:hypothetical protein